jgi:hypothetical protein
MGMLGMEERARHLGGICHFDSVPGRGARISMLLPCASALARRDPHKTALSVTDLTALRTAQPAWEREDDAAAVAPGSKQAGAF